MEHMAKRKLLDYQQICIELTNAYPAIMAEKNGKLPTGRELNGWIELKLGIGLIGSGKLNKLKQFFDVKFSHPHYQPLAAWEHESFLPWKDPTSIPLLLQLAAINALPIAPEKKITPAMAEWVLRLSNILPKLDLFERPNDQEEHPILSLARSYSFRPIIAEFIGEDKVTMKDIDIFLGIKPWLSETRYLKYRKALDNIFGSKAQHMAQIGLMAIEKILMELSYDNMNQLPTNLPDDLTIQRLQ
jgi:hypothetical protein